MSRRGIINCGYLASLLVELAGSATAQNLLIDNAGFEANTAYYSPGWGWPVGSPDALPGWMITLDPAGGGYTGAATNQSPQSLQGTHFGYIYSGTGSAGHNETAPASRAPVDPGTTYICWFLARGDSPANEALATASLIWYVNQNNDSTKGDPVSLDLVLAVRPSTDDPLSTFCITGAAPSGAHYAGVRITRPADNYDPIIVDDFVVMAEPTQVSLTITKKNGGVVFSWPRDLKHHLMANSNPALTNGWYDLTQPVKGIGAQNYVDCPMSGTAQFFRLTDE